MKSAAAALVLLCSCVIADSEEVAQTEQFLIPHCDDWGCGMNSPYVDSRGFHFLYRNGAMNPQGFSISQFEKGGTTYTFNVTNGRITGTKWGFPTLTDVGLIGARLHISFYGTPMYRIVIKGYSRVLSWAASSTGSRFAVDTYRLEWETLTDPYKFFNVCSHPGVDNTLGMNEYNTLVFEGDVIDATTKKVASTINNNVINFGCAGGTLAKQHLTGHTEVARRLGFTTSIPERQTMLKMLVADYCGDGVAHTVGGQPLQWADDHGWMHVTVASTREAQWTPEGASCLSTPRLAATDPVKYAELRDDVIAECTQPLTTCGGSAYVPDSGYHLISSNPQ